MGPLRLPELGYDTNYLLNMMRRYEAKLKQPDVCVVRNELQNK